MWKWEELINKNLTLKHSSSSNSPLKSNNALAFGVGCISLSTGGNSVSAWKEKKVQVNIFWPLNVKSCDGAGTWLLKLAYSTSLCPSSLRHFTRRCSSREEAHRSLVRFPLVSKGKLLNLGFSRRDRIQIYPHQCSWITNNVQAFCAMRLKFTFRVLVSLMSFLYEWKLTSLG